jgi:hypothetical protein
VAAAVGGCRCASEPTVHQPGGPIADRVLGTAADRDACGASFALAIIALLRVASDPASLARRAHLQLEVDAQPPGRLSASASARESARGSYALLSRRVAMPLDDGHQGGLPVGRRPARASAAAAALDMKTSSHMAASRVAAPGFG